MTMDTEYLFCTSCGQHFSINDSKWRCTCGSLLNLHFQPQFDKKKISSRSPDLWRYREALPIGNDANIISFQEGFTPLIEMQMGGKTFLIKQEHLFQTGSYKDRGAAILISKLKELGVKHIVEDSSGNAGCAIAAYAARAGISCDIFVPESTSLPKLSQIKRYQANLHRIPGSREDTAKAALKAADYSYYASHSWNPFFFHGTKTVAFEIWEQLGWKAPDYLVLPVGNGTLLLGAYIGFSELQDAGMIAQMPILIGVQAENCAPLYKAFLTQNQYSERIIPKPTVAEGIAIAEPVRGHEILTAIRNTNGWFITVTEDEILDALQSTGESGFYIEPTAAATIAALSKLSFPGDSSAVVVSVFSGHGLKSLEKTFPH